MNWRQLWTAGKALVTRGLQQVEAQVKHWTKPASDRQVRGIATELSPGEQELIAEHAFPCQLATSASRLVAGSLGQRNGECRPNAFLALERDRTAMQLD